MIMALKTVKIYDPKIGGFLTYDTTKGMQSGIWGTTQSSSKKNFQRGK